MLVVAAAVGGYLLGARHHSTATATATAAASGPSPSPSASPEVALPLAITGKRCSMPAKGRLQLGIEIVNQSADDLELRRVRAALPLGGLHPLTATWGGCGQLSPPAGDDNYPLPAGATTWLAITFDVLIPCPAPLPVQFTVDYTEDARAGSLHLPGFPDLGDVPYSNAPCPTRPAG